MECVKLERMNMEKYPLEILLIPFTLVKFVFNPKF